MTSIENAPTDEIIQWSECLIPETRAKACLDPYVDAESGCLPGCLPAETPMGYGLEMKAQVGEAQNSTQSEASSKIPMYHGCYFLRLRLNQYDVCPLLQGAFPDELPVVHVCRVGHHLVETSVYKTGKETYRIFFICDAEGHVIAAYCCVFNYEFACMLISRNDSLSTRELRSVKIHADIALTAWSSVK